MDVLYISDGCPGDLSKVSLGFFVGFLEIFDICPEIFGRCAMDN